MIPLTLKEIASALGATLIGDDCTISSVTTDSRKVEPDSLFLLLSRVKSLMDISFVPMSVPWACRLCW